MKARLITPIVRAALALGIGFGSSLALAAVHDVTGDVILMAPPASVVPDAAFSDDTVIHGFVEQRDLVLPALIAVDQAPEDLPLTIAAGTCVNVYLLHFDAQAQSNASGRLELDTPILGVISTQLALDLTNGTLGNAATRYPTSAECQVPPPGNGNCGLEANDAIDLQPQSIAVELRVNGPGDRVRVIARCDA